MNRGRKIPSLQFCQNHLFRLFIKIRELSDHADFLSAPFEPGIRFTDGNKFIRCGNRECTNRNNPLKGLFGAVLVQKIQGNQSTRRCAEHGILRCESNRLSPGKQFIFLHLITHLIALHYFLHLFGLQRPQFIINSPTCKQFFCRSHFRQFPIID